MQVKGTMAPTLILILLLLALRAQSAGAAPWQARGLGRWADEGQRPALAAWGSTHCTSG